MRSGRIIARGALPLLAATLGLVTSGAVLAGPAWAAPSPAVSVSPSANLTAGQQVAFKATGFPKGDTLIVAQCVNGAKGQEGCLGFGAGAVRIKAGEDGSASGTVKIVVGKVGTGLCDDEHPCVLSVTDLDTIGQGPGGQPVTVTARLTFKKTGGDPAPSPTASKSKPPKPSPTATKTPAPSPTATKGPELAETGGSGTTGLAVGAAGLVALGAAGMVVARRRRVTD